MNSQGLARRAFLQAGLAGAAGLALPFCRPFRGRALASAQDSFTPGGWLFVGTDGIVTVTLGVSDMGQGVHTALPMIVAEELDVAWDAIRVEQGAADQRFANPVMGRQRTAWSASVRGWWGPLRETAARARAMLVGAAAMEWGVSPGECEALAGVVRHPPTARSRPYAELVARAAGLPPPSRVSLKSPESFRILGRSLPDPAVAARVTGAAVYGLDSRPEGALVAVVARCPTVGGTLRRYDGATALGVPGVRRVVQISSGAAVVAESTWPALEGRRRLRIEWEAPSGGLDDSTVGAGLDAALETGGSRVEGRGRVRGALANAAIRKEAPYRTSLLAHAPMEPMNCFAHVGANACVVIVPTQDQTGVVETVRRLTGLPAGAITVRTTLLGGGFGRRVHQDFVADAVELSQRLGEPVQVVWTREDDFRHDFYHPATLHRLEGGIDPAGSVTAWAHAVAGGSGAAAAIPPYRFPHFEVRHAPADPGVRTGIWRSVDHFHCVFAAECFADELAQAGGIDPVEFRRGILEDPRLVRVLEIAAERSAWTRPLPEGAGRGVAVHKAHGSFIATVAEVEAQPGGPFRVRRIVCAVDPGTVIHPGHLTAQIEGAVAFGLSATLSERISLSEGAVKEGNFDRYHLLRMAEMPRVEVHLAPSGDAPGGVGELGVPPVAPAVCNALFAAGGGRIRTLPLRG